MSTSEMKAPATGATWFNLRRHDGEESDTAPEPAEGDTDAGDDDAQQMLADALDDASEEEEIEGADQLGDAGKQALQRMKEQLKQAKKELGELKESTGSRTGKQDSNEVRRARKEAADARKRASDLERKVQEFEDAKKSDLEKATGQAERAQQQAAKAVARAVSSEIKVAAGGTFADASDAVDVLMRDPSKYVDSEGEIDTDAIDADLADLLERKPHWGKPERAAAPAAAAESKPKPKPDLGQGSRGGAARVDFRDASDEDVAAELARYGVRKRY